MNAIAYLLGQGIENPLDHQSKALATRSGGFKPVIITAPKPPSANRKLNELLMIAASLSLSFTTSFADDAEKEAEHLEGLLRKAAKNLVEPAALYPRELAFKYGIEFGGELNDCDGLWERNNRYCEMCVNREACYGFESPANSAIKEG